MMHSKLTRAGMGSLLPVAVLALWWVATADSSSVYWPPLQQNLVAFWHTWTSNSFAHDLLPSALRLTVGLLCGSTLGISLGIAVGSHMRLRQLLAPYIEYCRFLPTPALVPVALAIFGPGTTMNIALVGWGVAWPVFVNTTDGVRGIESSYYDVAAVHRMSRWQILRTVILPAASPHIFVGLRIGVSVGLAVLIVAEMFAGNSGIGFVTIYAQNMFDIPRMWAGILLLAVGGIVLNSIILWAAHHRLRWHRSTTQTDIVQ